MALDARNNAPRDGRLEVGRQQERVAHGKAVFTLLDGIAIRHRCEREIVSTKKFDQRNVAGRIDSDNHGVVQVAIVHATFHKRVAGLNDMKVGQRVAIGRDDDTASSAVASGAKHTNGGSTGFCDRSDSLLLRFDKCFR